MTQKATGPNFTNELLAAGLGGLPFAWDALGNLTFGEAMTASQIAAVQAVYAAHDPSTVSAESVLAKRAAALGATDWLVTRHQEETLAGAKATLTEAQKMSLLAYRKALRDLPSMAGFPNVNFPTAPDFIASIPASSKAS
jgi:hypothetical protein